MFGDTAYKDYLTPEQQQDAQTQGWLGAANVLANMSAPHIGPSVQPTLLQLLSGGLGGYVGGQQDYVKQLASYYKPLQDMKRNNDMNTYMASPQGQAYTQSLGLPQGMPTSPELVTNVAQKRAEQTGAKQVDLQYDPQIQGAIEAAKTPTLVARAGAEEAAKNPALMARTAYDKKLDLSNQMYMDRNKVREVAPGASLVAPAADGSLASFYQTPEKAPPGYRNLSNGTMEAVPGGPADFKRDQAYVADTAALSSSSSDLDRLAQTAQDLKDHPGLKGITGLKGALPNVPGGKAADAQAKLDTLKSQVGFGVLQNMRNQSKTGGALGSVSDAEEKLLSNNLAALDKAQSYEEYQKQLGKIIDYTTDAKKRLNDAYSQKYQQRQQSTQGWSFEKVQ
jgi:hypothetical protein